MQSTNNNTQTSLFPSKQSPWKIPNSGTILSYLAVAILSYQLGSLSHFVNVASLTENTGFYDLFTSNRGDCSCDCTIINNNNNNNNAVDDVHDNNNSQEQVPMFTESGTQEQQETIITDAPQTLEPEFTSTVDDKISSNINRLFVGAARVSRKSFISNFDLGVPWIMNNNTYYQDVVLLYPEEYTFPKSTRSMARDNNGGFPNLQYKSAIEATEKCESVKVMLMLPDEGSCLAIVPQWSSHVIHSFLRWNERALSVSRKDKLRHVSRFHNYDNGYKDARLPTREQTNEYLPVLTDYVQNLNSTLERLQPLLDDMMIRYESTNNIVAPRRNRRLQQKPAVVVMVCNYGQSELFLNFICSAKSRGLDLSRILLFATDQDMYDLAKNIGEIQVFDVAASFGGEGIIPTRAAQSYGDNTFTNMMFAKVFCVHLVNYLGYDVLFQDVDIVWYKNPLDFFENLKLPETYDFYFQDDGARSNRYAPFSPNSGFYYVRYNRRTLFFFSVFMRMGDAIVASGSHQAVLNGLLEEQSSSKGLSVKVFERDAKMGLEFPGGYHYHMRKNWIREVILGKHNPYLFHMSWTKNKVNKIKFLQQMGDWFLKEECFHTVASNISGIESDFTGSCCSADMLFQCHYSDKPSKKSCKGSPKIDSTGRQFWP